MTAWSNTAFPSRPAAEPGIQRHEQRTHHRRARSHQHLLRRHAGRCHSECDLSRFRVSLPTVQVVQVDVDDLLPRPGCAERVRKAASGRACLWMLATALSGLLRRSCRVVAGDDTTLLARGRVAKWPALLAVTIDRASLWTIGPLFAMPPRSLATWHTPPALPPPRPRTPIHPAPRSTIHRHTLSGEASERMDYGSPGS